MRGNWRASKKAHGDGVDDLEFLQESQWNESAVSKQLSKEDQWLEQEEQQTRDWREQSV